MELTDTQFHRYARHLILDEVGDEGQERLLGSRVLVIGAGGLGSPLLMYLAAAGVGTLGIVDDDLVDITNLQRQIVHTTPRLGEGKVASAAAAVRDLNPDVKIDSYPVRLSAGSAADLIRPYDLVVDGSDNFATRYLVNDACFLLSKPLVTAALLRFEGQLFTFDPKHRPGTPCYRCVFPEAPGEDVVPRCDQAGILGAVAGVMGTCMAAEVLKELLGIGTTLAGHMLLYDALDTRFQRIAVPADPACPLCGSQPSITDLSVHRPAA